MKGRGWEEGEVEKRGGGKAEVEGRDMIRMREEEMEIRGGVRKRDGREMEGRRKGGNLQGRRWEFHVTTLAISTFHGDRHVSRKMPSRMLSILFIAIA